MEQLPLDAALVAQEARGLVSTGADIRGPGDIYRYSLWRRWDVDKPMCLFVGHNPSTAAAIAEDPTTRRWRKFAEAWGYGGYVAVNLYPYRSPTPSLCYAWHDAKLGENGSTELEVAIAMQQNIGAILAEAAACFRVVVCWGEIARPTAVVPRVIGALYEKHPDLYCFGTTKSGAPKHPMARGKSRVPDDFQPVIWYAP